MTDENWLTVSEIAERLRVTDQTVRRWLRAGNLVGRNFGGKAGYRVKEEDFQDFLKRDPSKV